MAEVNLETIEISRIITALKREIKEWNKILENPNASSDWIELAYKNIAMHEKTIKKLESAWNKYMVQLRKD